MRPPIRKRSRVVSWSRVSLVLERLLIPLMCSIWRTKLGDEILRSGLIQDNVKLGGRGSSDKRDYAGALDSCKFNLWRENVTRLAGNCRLAWARRYLYEESCSCIWPAIAFEDSHLSRCRCSVRSEKRDMILVRGPSRVLEWEIEGNTRP